MVVSADCSEWSPGLSLVVAFGMPGRLGQRYPETLGITDLAGEAEWDTAASCTDDGMK